MYLRDYQRDGVAFFFRQYAQNQGGILGDDMVSHLSFRISSGASVPAPPPTPTHTHTLMRHALCPHAKHTHSDCSALLYANTDTPSALMQLPTCMHQHM